MGPWGTRERWISSSSSSSRSMRLLRCEKINSLSMAAAALVMTHFCEQIFLFQHTSLRSAFEKLNRATSCFAFSGANICVLRVGGPWNCCTIDSWWWHMYNCVALETSGCHTGELAYFLTLHFNSDVLHTVINCVLRMGALLLLCAFICSLLCWTRI